MKKIFLTKLIFLLSVAYATAQTWQWSKHIGGSGMDYASIGYVDAQHNSYLYGGYAGPYASNNYYNCYIANDTLIGSNASFLAKYDENGNLLWVRNCVSPIGNNMGIDGFVFDAINSVFYITGGYINSCNIDTCTLTAPSTAFLAKLNTDGHCLWAKNIGTTGGGVGTALGIDNTGNIYLAGTTAGTINVGADTITPGTFLAKFDSNGNSFWAKTKFSYTNFPLNQPEMEILQLKCYNNNVFAYGSAGAINGTLTVDTISITNINGEGYGLLCMDTTGVAKWFKLDGLPNTSTPVGASMGVSTNGYIYVGSAFYDTCFIQQDTLVANNTVNGFLSKYDSTGSLIYVKQIYSTFLAGCFAINIQNDSTIFLTGELQGQGTFGTKTISASTSQDIFIARYDNNGNCIAVSSDAGAGNGWSVFGDNSGIYITGLFPMLPTNSGSITIGSNTFSTYGWQDIVFAKHDMLTAVETEGRYANNQLVIYANPNKGSFRVKVPDEFQNEQNLLLNIYDNTGKLIQQQNLNMTDAHPRLNIIDQPAGNYLVTMSNGKKTYSGRMIVE